MGKLIPKPSASTKALDSLQWFDDPTGPLEVLFSMNGCYTGCVTGYTTLTLYTALLKLICKKTKRGKGKYAQQDKEVQYNVITVSVNAFIICQNSCQDQCCFHWIFVSFYSSPVNQSAVIYLNVTYSSKWNYSSIITVPKQVTHVNKMNKVVPHTLFKLEKELKQK